MKATTGKTIPDRVVTKSRLTRRKASDIIEEEQVSKNPQAHEFLSAAAAHMQDRADTYDKPEGERSMAATVDAFNAVTGDGRIDTEERGWLFMALLKAVRSQQGGYRQDNYEDGAAYFALSGEAAAKTRGV